MLLIISLHRRCMKGQLLLVTHTEDWGQGLTLSLPQAVVGAYYPDPMLSTMVISHHPRTNNRLHPIRVFKISNLIEVHGRIALNAYLGSNCVFFH